LRFSFLLHISFSLLTCCLRPFQTYFHAYSSRTSDSGMVRAMALTSWTRLWFDAGVLLAGAHFTVRVPALARAISALIVRQDNARSGSSLRFFACCC